MKKRSKKSKNKAPMPSKRRGRKLGAYGDKIKIADDFDAPLPENILEAFEERLAVEDTAQQEE